jgi:hypothetical protein
MILIPRIKCLWIFSSSNLGGDNNQPRVCRQAVAGAGWYDNCLAGLHFKRLIPRPHLSRTLQKMASSCSTWTIWYPGVLM